MIFLLVTVLARLIISSDHATFQVTYYNIQSTIKLKCHGIQVIVVMIHHCLVRL